MTSLTGRFFAQAERRPGVTCFASRDQSGWNELSWFDAGTKVRAVMSGLRAAGVKPGDRVLLLAENRPEWAIFDLAIMGIGALVVPAYVTHTRADLCHIFDLVTPNVLIASSPELTRRGLDAATDYRGLDLVWSEFPETLASNPPGPSVRGWGDLLGHEPNDAGLYEAAEDDTCCLIFTSGTSGLPKAAMLTHQSIGANVDDALEILQRFDFGEKDRFLSFLPLAHAYEHTAGLHMPISMGAEIWFCDSTEKLQQYLPEVSPTVATAVPRLYDLLHARINGQLKSASAAKKWLFKETLRLGKKRIDNEPLNLFESVLDRLLDRMVREKVRQRFGGKIRFFISGGAPLNPEIGEFFTSLGVGIIQGYGQTEASPLISVNSPDWIKLHTVGRKFDQVEIKFADDGELLVKGPCVMKGYWEDAQATAGTIIDGWLHTGDLATMDEDGFLQIVGRKKDLIVTSGGDNIAPSKLEMLLCSQPEVEQAVVFGDGRPWLGAVLIPSADLIDSCAGNDDQLVLELNNALKRANSDLNQSERMRKFVIQSDPCSIENGLLTPTQKVRRGQVLKNHEKAIAALY